VSKWWFERENSAKILFATTAFGEGIHHESVEFVIHYRKCYSIIDYFQQIGRAARGNKLIGKCLFLLDTVESKNCSSDEKYLRDQVLLNDSNCRWTAMAKYFDDRDNVTCQTIECAISCDICSLDHWSREFVQFIFQKQNQEVQLSVIEVESQKDITIQEVNLILNDEAIEISPAISQKDSDIRSLQGLLGFLANIMKQTNPCYLCCQNGHNMENCMLFQNTCLRCGQKHFVRNCSEQKPKLDGICQDCFLPHRHNYEGHKFICYPVCFKILLCGYQKTDQFERSYKKFMHWYLNKTTTWTERIELIQSFIEIIHNQKHF
jgi:hypothetical protein